MQHPDNDIPVEADFEVAADEIGSLIDHLVGEGLCASCVARALLYHGACLTEHEVGRAEAIEAFAGIVDQMRTDYAAAAPAEAVH
jgi:hypothetical protein